MKYLVLLSLVLGGCQTATRAGDCIGFLTSEDPRLSYEISPRNLVVTVVTSPLIVPVVMWPIDYAKCPTHRRLEYKDSEIDLTIIKNN